MSIAELLPREKRITTSPVLTLGAIIFFMIERIFGKRGLDQQQTQKPKEEPFAESMYARLHDEEILLLLEQRRQILAYKGVDPHRDDPDRLQKIEKSIRARYESLNRK